jgi:cytosine/adenosine deaminase-related metal-dependent hydrolase
MKKQNITIENAWICSVVGEDIIPFFGDIIISGGMIDKIRPKNFQTYLKNPTRVGKESFNASGRVVTLPLINFHDHIYSRLAKGLSLKGKLDNFQNILKNLWWKLDITLDMEMISASAKMTALESIHNGVTYIVDHHSSQSEISGSLDTLKNDLGKFGLRGILCFEATDRNGSKPAMAGLDENLNFMLSNSNDDFKAMLGLHASFTLSDELLREAHRLMKFGWGIHIHVAEDESDIKLSLEYAKFSPVQRLKNYQLMNEKSILVHGVHLKEKDFLKISTSESALAFCLDSNMNNSVGLPQFAKIPNAIPLLIGTDGMHANIARSFKQLFLVARDQGMSADQSFTLIKKIYFDEINFIRKYFPDFPYLLEKDRADLIVWDYIPPTPISKDNFWGHFIYGMTEYAVNSVIQNGIFLMKNFEIVNADESKIKNDIYLQGERLVNKMK